MPKIIRFISDDAMADLPRGRPVLVLIGGAGRLDPATAARLEPLFADLAAAAQAHGWVVVDGGTDAGIMRLMGRARAAQGATFPLVGVAPAAKVRLPDHQADPDAAEPEPHHTHLVLTPGRAWGDEAPYLARVATMLAQGAPTVAVLINGGSASRRDVEAQRAEGRRVLAVAGTGRLADALAQDPPPGVEPVPWTALITRVRDILGPEPEAKRKSMLKSRSNPNEQDRSKG